MNQKSFTLIELLVVIAIIGLITSVTLVAIDLPGQRQRARIAKLLEFSSSIQNSLGSEARGIWDFDENGGTVATDRSGYRNNGTVSGATYTTDTPQKIVGPSPGKYALNFNGVDGFVRINHNASLNFGTGSFSLEFWIKRQGAFTGTYDYAAILGKIYLHPEYAGSYGWLLSIPSYSDSTVAPIWRNVDGFFFGPNIGLPLNSWTHVVYAISRSGSAMNVKSYINGALTGSVNFTSSNSFDNSEPLKIYASGGGWGDYIVKTPSLMDEVRIYAQALTIGQIQKHYAEGLGRHQDFAIK